MHKYDSPYLLNMVTSLHEHYDQQTDRPLQAAGAGSPLQCRLQKHVANCLNKFAAAAVIKHCKKEKEQL